MNNEQKLINLHSQLCSIRYSAAFFSASPPISPIIMVFWFWIVDEYFNRKELLHLMPTLSVCHRATGNSTCLAANRLSSYQRNFTFRVSILSFVCCWGCREGFKKSKIGIPNTSATKCKKDRIKMTYNTNKLGLSQATLGVQLSKDKFIYIQMQTSLVDLII